VTFVKRQREGADIAFSLFISIVSILVALAVSAAVVKASHLNPQAAFRTLFVGAFGSMRSLSEVLIKTTPLSLAGLGVAFAFKGGAFNIGADGQLNMGALASIVVCLTVGPFVGWLGVPLGLASGCVLGGVYGAFAGWMRAKLKVSEVIVTIMLNFIATLLINHLVHGPLKDPTGFMPQTAEIPVTSRLPLLIATTRLHAGVLVAVAAAILVYILLFFMPFGYKVRCVGINQTAAMYGGIDVERVLVATMFVSGCLAGLAGAIEVLGIHYRLLEGISPGYGFDAIAVALLGKLNPLAIPVSAFLFGALRVGANSMQRVAHVPSTLVYLIQGIVVLFLLGGEFFARYRIRFLRREA